MKKTTTSFVCQECGYDSAKYLGKCPECGLWNSFKEIRLTNSKQQAIGSNRETNLTPKPLSEITYSENERTLTGFGEMDGVLGGGIVPGSVTLVAGDPGIGKSTLLLQVALYIAKSKKETKASVLYISAEESEEQVKLRANRIAPKLGENLLLLSATDTDAIAALIEDKKPSLVIIDSIQTVQSENAGGLSGSVGQIRYGAAQFVRVAKTSKIPFIIVGHVTKEGMVAGPMVLSHMVDTVLFLEGEKTTQTRLLRSLKNRFGPVDEVGVFTMVGQGMVEIKNPEEIFLTKTQEKAPGSVLTVILEGTRTFLIEIQALAVFSKLPFPRRVVSGMDSRRVELLLAVLQKHCRLGVDTMDIFINVAGGIKINDTASDLAVCLAIYSSVKNIPLSSTVAMAEVGLLGELRGIGLLEKRIKEAKKLGFKSIISTQSHNGIRSVLESVGKI